METTKKTAYVISLFLRAILGEGEHTENIIEEVLQDGYTNEKMKPVIADIDDRIITEIVAILASNSVVTETLNRLPGSPDEKRRAS